MASEAARRFASQLGVSLQISTVPTLCRGSGNTTADKKNPENRESPRDAAILQRKTVPTVPTGKTESGNRFSVAKPPENRAFLARVPTVPTVPSENNDVRALLTNETDAPHIGVEPITAPRPTRPPDDELVEALAIAMSRKQGVTIIDPVKAMEYLRASARNRLARTDDPMVRGLLLGFEQSRTPISCQLKEQNDED